MPTHKIRLLFLAALSLTSASAQTYHVTDLGTLPGQQLSTPAAVNNNGQVTGSTESVAFLYSNGSMQNLGTLPGGSISRGNAIKSAGDVAGSSQFTNGGSIQHATLFRNGTATDLGFLALYGNYSFGTGINFAQQVVGYSAPSSSSTNTRAFIWDAANGMRDMGTLGGQYSRAFSINNGGVATGSSQVPTGFGASHAFIWDSTNGMRDIGTIAGDSSSGASINANNHIVGTSTINGFDNRQHAFLYDGVAIRNLGAIGNNDFLSDRSTGYGINIHDIVVGTTYRPYTGGALYQIPFVYRDGQMLDLETLVDASGADYRLYTATGINDGGQIVVDAIKQSINQRRAVLLTPVITSTSFVSRKTHGPSGEFDINLPLTGNPGIECRTGGTGSSHTLVVSFNNSVVSGNASVTSGTGNVAGSPAFSGNTMTVNLTGVANAQIVTATLSNVTDSFAQVLPDTNLNVAFLVGDTNGDRFVNAGDALQTRNRAGQVTDVTNFRSDVNTDGLVNSGDTLILRASSGSSLP